MTAVKRYAEECKFQSTPAQSRRRNIIGSSSLCFYFNPLQRKAGDQRQKCYLRCRKIFQSTPAQSRRPCAAHGVYTSGRFQSTPAQSRRLHIPDPGHYLIRFQSTPAQSRRRQFYPNNHIINHHFLYKTSNFTLTSPNPITKTNHKPFFYQCESLHIFMFTYLSHYPVLFYYNTLPSIIPETFSPIPTPKDTLHKNIFDIPRPGILLLVPGL